MKLSRTALIAGAMIMTGWAASAATCEAPRFSGAFLNPVPTSGINQTLFSRALTMQANYIRCTHGRRALVTKSGLIEISTIHSRWMAQAQDLSHASKVPGKRKLFGRAVASGLPFRRASENLVVLGRFQFGTAKFRIANAGACQFAYHDNRPIPAHNYASLAKMAVEKWMASPGHRRNLLGRSLRLAGAGIGYDPKSNYCGRFYITQEYLG